MRAEVRVSGTVIERIQMIADRQRGRVARRQLQAAGVDRHAVARLVERKWLRPLPGGVFIFGHAGPVEFGQETAALLACSEGAALCRGSAARLWDLRPETAGVHVVVPGHRSGRGHGFVVHRARSLSARDLRVRHGLPATSPARTLFDEAPVLAPRELEFAFDKALVSRVMRLREVGELLSRVRGRPGAPALQALFDQHTSTTMTRSHAEELFLDLIRKAQLPHPRVNARVAGYEVDFFWPEHRLIVEIDGFRFHSTRRAFDHDHTKDLNLRQAGFDVLRFTYRHLEREQLLVVATVTRGLDADPQVATISAPSSGEMATSSE